MSFNQPVNRFRLDHIVPGKHFVTITRANSYHGHAMGGPGHQVVFRGFVNVPAYSEMHAMIDRSFRLRINKIEPLYAEYEGNCEDPYEHGGHDGFHENHNTSDGYYGSFDHGCSNQSGCNYYNNACSITDESFSGLISTLTNMSFESSRMQVAQNAIASNYFTSRQVSELMRMMTFDSSRLEIAKMAFGKTIDKENYWMVNNQFTFESSIVELNNYIHRS